MAIKKLITSLKQNDDSSDTYYFGADSDNIIVNINDTNKTTLQKVINFLTNFFTNVELIQSKSGENGPTNDKIKIWLDTTVQQQTSNG